MAIAAEWLEIAQWSQRRTFRKPRSLFHRWPLRPSSAKWRSQMHPTRVS